MQTRFAVWRILPRVGSGRTGRQSPSGAFLPGRGGPELVIGAAGWLLF